MRIAVLAGGTSAERDVSLVSGRAIAAALAGAGHDVRVVDTATGSALPVEQGDPEAVDGGIGLTPAVIERETGSALRAVSSGAVADADVVFVALHGGAGEDGTVQGLLELAGKRYTGSGVRASALAMDKRVSKLLFREVGVPTPAWRVVRVGDGEGSPAMPGDLKLRDVADEPSRQRALREAADALGGFPLVVKPNDQGSTVGLTVVEEADRLSHAVKLAAEYGNSVLLETFIPGREMTVAVLGGGALPVVEIRPRKGLYDYESKYQRGMSEYLCPAPVEDALARRLSELAVRAYECLGCAGYARVDFRVTSEGEPYCLEANTVPGMTATSLVPMAAAARGMTFAELVARIVELAV